MLYQAAFTVQADPEDVFAAMHEYKLRQHPSEFFSLLGLESENRTQTSFERRPRAKHSGQRDHFYASCAVPILLREYCQAFMSGSQELFLDFSGKLSHN